MTIRILAADDEPDVLGLVETKLQKAGFEVMTANDGEEAVQKALAEKPDVIVMDVMMPSWMGFLLALKSKKNSGMPRRSLSC